MSRLHRVLTIAFACLVFLLGGRMASAEPKSPAAPTGQNPLRFGQVPRPTPLPESRSLGPAKIRLTNEDGSPGPVQLVPKSGGFAGEFLVWNDGPGLLTVSRVALRGDADDPRLPARLTARFTDGGGASGVVQPRSSKKIAVTWVPEHDTKLHQALGHVVLTSNDEVAGEVAMGFVATYASPLAAHLLTCLVFLPLLGAGLVVLLRVAFDADDDRLRGVALAFAALQALFAIVLYQGFSGAVTRVDGNDGFQFVERVVLVRSLGVEYFVGVDGTSVTLVLLAATLGFVAAIASYAVETEVGRPGLASYYGLLGLVLGGAMGVFVSLDLSAFAAFWCMLWGAVVALVARFTPAREGSSIVKLAASAAVSSVLLLVAVVALYQRSDPTFLADGTRVNHTFAIPELMRVAYNAKHLTLLGASWVKVVWGCLFVAFAIAVALAPLQGWLALVVDRAPAPVAVVVAGVAIKTGVYGLLRVSLGILPDGSRWAATTLVAAGVLHVVISATMALRASSAERGPTGACYAVAAPMGFCLLGLGSMTREGLAGCLVLLFSHGIVAAAVILLVRRDGAPSAAPDVTRASGQRLRYGLAGAALVALTAVPGSASFWGESLAILGAFPANRLLAAVAALAAAALAIAQVRALGRGPTTPLAGALSAREGAALTPLVVLAVALGLDPAPFFTTIQGGVSDLNLLVNPVGPDEVARAECTEGSSRSRVLVLPSGGPCSDAHPRFTPERRRRC